MLRAVTVMYGHVGVAIVVAYAYAPELVIQIKQTAYHSQTLKPEFRMV